jgi:hypothetical protein
VSTAIQFSPECAKYIGISILRAIHAFTDADDSDALALLYALRSQVFRST